MLSSQKYDGPWEVEEDIAYSELPKRRSLGANPPMDSGGPSDDAFRAERGHIRSFGIDDADRISTFLGITPGAYEKRLSRSAR